MGLSDSSDPHVLPGGPISVPPEEIEEDTEAEGLDDSQDPFSPTNLPIIQYITQARLYDAIMALLTHLDKDKARDLLELHATGAFMGPSPNMNGQFVTDEIIAADEQERAENK